jgi:EAL domain-containing protein (putative c-di-GMP-specific phosphodiesterase class I)
MHDVQMSPAVVSCIRDLGFRVAIDDFGTGQAALEQLKRLQVDELKIDKSFVLNMDDRKDEAIIRATIDLAHQFDLCVVAEGVEHAASLERLRSLECEYAQGFHIARPMPSAEFLTWAQAWKETGGAGIVPLVERGSATG